MATRTLNLTDQIKQYFESTPTNNSIAGVRVRDFARELPGAIGKVGAEVGRQIALTPVRVGASLAEIPRIYSGGEPLEPFNVPFLGQAETYARNSVDTAESMGGGPLAVATGIVGAGSRAIGDIATLGGLAQGFTGETPTNVNDLFIDAKNLPNATGGFVNNPFKVLRDSPPITHLQSARNQLVENLKFAAKRGEITDDVLKQALAKVREPVSSLEGLDNAVKSISGLPPGVANTLMDHVAVSQMERSILAGEKMIDIPINKIVNMNFDKGFPSAVKERLLFEKAANLIPDPGAHSVLGKPVTIPINVRANPNGTFDLIDGNHRLVQGIINGAKTIKAFIEN